MMLLFLLYHIQSNCLMHRHRFNDRRDSCKKKYGVDLIDFQTLIIIILSTLMVGLIIGIRISRPRMIVNSNMACLSR